MIKIFFDFLKILDKQQKKKLIYLQFLIIIMSLLEVLSIISIYPFVSSLNENSNILAQPIIKNILLLFGSDSNALIVFGIIFVTCFLLSTLISILTVYKLVMLSQKIGAELSNRLFNFYINQEWDYHIQNTSSTITNKIALEAKRVTGILQSLLSLSAMLVKSVVIIISLLIFDFKITIYSFLVFTSMPSVSMGVSLPVEISCAASVRRLMGTSKAERTNQSARTMEVKINASSLIPTKLQILS